jgi:hypothetical protein
MAPPRDNAHVADGEETATTAREWDFVALRASWF